MPTPETHALLSASSSDRWLHCPPSAKLAAQYPAKTSDYAEAGRVAHAIAELKARKHFVEPMSARSFAGYMRKYKADPHYDAGMEAATDMYLDTLKDIAMGYDSAPFVALEQRVSFDDIVPGGFGTADCIMISGDTIIIVDYKNGQGVPVEAKDNSQLMLYAWGALRSYHPIYGGMLRRVIMVIVQPHAGGVKQHQTTVDALTEWAHDVVAPTAALAADGAGVYQHGDWCHFCPAKGNCRARAEAMLALEPEAERDPATLTPEELGDVLARARHLEAWAKDLKAHAFSRAMAGHPVPGHKLVAGRKSRDWSDGTDAAFAALVEREVPEAMLYERTPVTVAKLEKALGTAEFKAKAADLVATRPGKPTLVPDSDARPEYSPAAAAFEAVIPDG